MTKSAIALAILAVAFLIIFLDGAAGLVGRHGWVLGGALVAASACVGWVLGRWAFEGLRGKRGNR